MSDEFPSIWLEYQSDNKKKPTLISGFYRVWTQDGEKTTEGQLARIKVFNSQIEQAFEQKIKMNMMILGDANLCADKWFYTKFLNKKCGKSTTTYLVKVWFENSRCGSNLSI